MKMQTSTHPKPLSECVLGYYSQTGDTCHYALWFPDNTMRTRHMHTNQRPSWLQIIVDVAVVGGHMQKHDTPPPESTVWFEADDTFRLIRFIDRSKQHVSNE